MINSQDIKKGTCIRRRSIRFGTASTQHRQQNDSYQPKLSLHHLTVI